MLKKRNIRTVRSRSQGPLTARRPNLTGRMVAEEETMVRRADAPDPRKRNMTPRHSPARRTPAEGDLETKCLLEEGDRRIEIVGNQRGMRPAKKTMIAGAPMRTLRSLPSRHLASGHRFAPAPIFP